MAVIYVLTGTTKTGALEIFYCGRADNPERRFADHQRDCANPLTTKAAYEWARQAYNGRFELHVIAEEGTLNGDGVQNTEDYWVCKLIEEGHPLQNAVRGNKAVPKKRSTNPLQKLFREVNQRARDEDAKAKHQTLTKPQILHQRILNQMPDAGQLHALEWIEQPPEHLGVREARGVTRCEYTKWGDYAIYLGWKNKGKRVASTIYDRRRRLRYGISTFDMRIPYDRLQILEMLVKCWESGPWWEY